MRVMAWKKYFYMKKYIFSFLLATFCLSAYTEAQVGIYIGPRFGYGPSYGPRYGRRPQRPPKDFVPFEPSVNVSFGYGFPNLDQYELPDFYNLYRSNVTSQTGPITGSIDYRFSRSLSLGVLVTHGNVSAPYYAYNQASSTPALTGSLENWSVMLNIMHYFSYGHKVTPYIRTAIGVNTWQQDFKDPQGNKVNMDGTPSQLAYQAGLGADFYLSKNAGLFVEGGYGKYILNGGITFKF